jgi:hypothetical protein
LIDAGVNGARAAEVAPRLAERSALRADLDSPYRPNFNYVKAAPEIKAAMEEVYDLAHARIAKGREGVQTHDKTLTEADAIITGKRMTVESLLEREPVAEPVAAAELTAMRQLEVGAAEYVSAVKDRVLKGEAQPGDLRRALTLHAEVSERVSLAKTGTARALESLKIEAEAKGKITSEALARIADGIDPRVSEMDLARTLQVAEAAEGAAGVSRLSQLVTSLPGAFMEYFYGVILSGKAIGRNAFGNGVGSLLTLPERALAGYMPKSLAYVTPKAAQLKPGIVPGETAAYVHGFWEGLRRNVVAKARLAELEEVGRGKFDLINDAEAKITARNMGAEGIPIVGPGLDMLGTGVRLFPKVLERNDVWTKSYVVNGELHAAAYKKAVTEGLTGDKFTARYMALLDDVNLFSKSERADIARRTKQVTMTSEIENPLMRRVAAAFDASAASGAASRFLLVAFPRITSNIFETFASYTPILNLAAARFWSEMKAGGERAQLAYARLTLGASIYSLILYSADEGVITGDLPTDPTRRQQALHQENYQERSIKIAGKWRSYRGMGVLEDIFAMAVNARNIITQIPDKDLSKVALASALSMWDVVQNMSFLTMLGDALSAGGHSTAPEARVGALERFAEQKALSLLPMSGALRELRKTFDATRREVESFTDRFRDAIPGLSTLKDKDGNDAVPPRRDMITGRPLVMENYPFIPGNAVKAEHNPVWEEVHRLQGAGLRPLPGYITPGADRDRDLGLTPDLRTKTSINLTPQEQDRWAELMTIIVKDGMGRTLQQRLKAEMTSDAYKRASDSTKAADLQRIYSDYRNVSRTALIQELPKLRAAIEKATAEDNVRQLPPERQGAALNALRERVRIAQ